VPFARKKRRKKKVSSEQPGMRRSVHRELETWKLTPTHVLPYFFLHGNATVTAMVAEGVSGEGGGGARGSSLFFSFFLNLILS